MNESDFSSEAVAARLRHYRDLKGLTQDDVTERLSLGTRVLAGWEQGRNVPPDKELHRMAKLYGTHAAILRYGDGVMRDAVLAETEGTMRRAIEQLTNLADRMKQQGADPRIANTIKTLKAADAADREPSTKPTVSKPKKRQSGS